jgi:hypothetical protein
VVCVRCRMKCATFSLVFCVRTYVMMKTSTLADIEYEHETILDYSSIQGKGSESIICRQSQNVALVIISAGFSEELFGNCYRIDRVIEEH